MSQKSRGMDFSSRWVSVQSVQGRPLASFSMLTTHLHSWCCRLNTMNYEKLDIFDSSVNAGNATSLFLVDLWFDLFVFGCQTCPHWYSKVWCQQEWKTVAFAHSTSVRSSMNSDLAICTDSTQQIYSVCMYIINNIRYHGMYVAFDQNKRVGKLS